MVAGGEPVLGGMDVGRLLEDLGVEAGAGAGLDEAGSGAGKSKGQTLVCSVAHKSELGMNCLSSASVRLRPGTVQTQF